MPPRNAPLPNAVNLFNCNICDKGYPRQVDYENHLRSYDHNHRQRLAEMKKLTAANEGESNRPSKGPLDMRSIPMDDSGKKPGLGPRFTKIGGTAAAAGGGRFKKVGVAVSGGTNSYDTKTASEPAKVEPVKEVKAEEVQKADRTPKELKPQALAADAIPESQSQSKKDEDVVMGENEGGEVITWEEYDFMKPTGCDHVNCPGCTTTGTYEDGWLVIDAA